MNPLSTVVKGKVGAKPCSTVIEKQTSYEFTFSR